jgi:hypothetical protein
MDEVKLQFVKTNIVRLNESKVKEFLDSTESPFPNDTELGYFLKEKFLSEIDEIGDLLWKEWEELNFAKSKYDTIAVKYFVRKSEVQQYLENRAIENLLKRGLSDNFNSIVELVTSHIDTTYGKPEFKVIKSEFQKVFRNSLNISLQCGFPVNLQKINSGIMTANAGDSAQFLFLARAILVGLNCSNVDVRSSRYDAIVDYKGKLFRIQVKGVSDANISFKDRDRGGQGIDTSHERNQGKRITSKDCDIYVAVDKKVGLCYLIPMNWVDTLDDSQIVSVKLQSVEHFRENWNIFDDLLTS